MNWAKLLASVAACQLAGILGAIFTRSAIPSWYAALKKPCFTPPGGAAALPLPPLGHERLGVEYFNILFEPMNARSKRI